MDRIETMSEGGKAIMRRRKDIGLTQRSFAKEVGVSESAISRWELGEVEPSAKHRPRIAFALKIESFSSLYYGAA
jgi:transcriptional regulator with XRE-family HTH domain|tara:strand:+ start:985 stop:1209 length:225 start_codon:yes stop_codon:yes gene_type:complete